ncbi:hypothetical protein GGI12_000800 [Dipsacomyces acuminosporus]|nr:hypothetical protein GGI12_000800 [Dipsacomyces acuminosporus]
MIVDAGTEVMPDIGTIPTKLDNGYTAGAAEEQPQPYQFIDYRAAASPDSHKRMPAIVKGIIEGITTKTTLPGSSVSCRSLPTLLLYDDHGLDLFDQITYLPEYYLTNCEIEVLKTNIANIVAEIPNNSDVVELGCGSLRKTQILLDALNKHREGVRYYAIDVMPQPLHSSMQSLAPKFPGLSLTALCGTYDEVLVHFKKSTRPKTILWLGSSIGNHEPSEATKFLTGISTNALVPGDAIIIGMDKQKDSAVIMDAYHDSCGLTDEFELNGLAHANAILSKYASQISGTSNSINSSSSSSSKEQPFDVTKFSYVGEYNESIGRHDAYLVALEDTSVCWPQEIAVEAKEICGSDEHLLIKKGERIYIESSRKYSECAPEVLAKATGLIHTAEWPDSRNYYALNLFRKSSEPARRARQLAARPPLYFSTIPSVGEWEQLWAAWDTLCLHIIPRSKLHQRSIDLRHPFIFYLGHIPAFADIHMSAAESAPLTEPQIFARWFERGIDPNIEDLSIGHSHSEVPDEWPPVEDILAYSDRVRSRVRSWVSSYEQAVGAGESVSAEAARHVWMAFEHEAMHLETMFYMVLQLPPSDINHPISCPIPKSLDEEKPSVSWITYNGSKSSTVLGLSGDNEALLVGSSLPPGHVFGWDNESPPATVPLNPFTIRTQPITNGEYMEFLAAMCESQDEPIEPLVPKSWIALDTQTGMPAASSISSPGLASDYGVRTVVGSPSIAATQAKLWPVFVSQTQAAAYAKWQGKRLPSEAEWAHASRTYHLARSLNDSSNDTSVKYSDFGGDIDGYLDAALMPYGVKASAYFQGQPYDVFAPRDANIGFAHWHPTPVPTRPDALVDSSNELPDAAFLGSGWEWTATQFYPFDGFQPSPMYPGYSADFFEPGEAHANDSSHFVIRGGSYATHPRMALRHTFRNWYQRGYPYVLATFRLCEGVE